MVISEKQVQESMMVAHIYLRFLEDITKAQPDIISECGKHNKIYIAQLLQEIVSQQSAQNTLIQ